MDKVKKIFKPGKDADGSEVMYGTPEPKNVHPSEDDSFPGSSAENRAESAPEEGMGTNQVETGGRTGNPEAHSQGNEAGMGTTQTRDESGYGGNPDAAYQAPESGMGTAQTGSGQGFAGDERGNQGPEAGLGTTQGGGMGGDSAPESGMGRQQADDF